jgi:hypothetical protein
VGEVLGKITATGRFPRGPDAKHRIAVDREWLEEGAAIEIELPRNLTCAACDGGGCDTCERSGAVSVRSRGEARERIQVTLPACGASSETRGIVLRIPDSGGLAAPESDLPRGILLLSVLGSEQADASVRMIHSTLPPPEVIARLSSRAPAGLARRPLLLVWSLILLLLFSLLILRHLKGL